ncbi:SDR family oxidoreductase [Gordonia sp. (in: high G+C Gram-positive bacteria)]|uniref:SDR family oxidoreductase n=1 Tax=Gordonia sp. (in: high G+C Gram-positive bacteria) TaxID=84139 RepID=UPI0039E5D4A1
MGEKTAALFASRGAQVWIGDLDEDVAKQTAAAIPGAVARRLDVTDRASWAPLIDEILAEHGRLDVLVNNAGVMPVGPFADEPEATTDLMLDVNVRGVLNGMHAVLPLMAQAGRGHVVNVSSMAGMIPLPGMVTYNTSKYAVLGGSLAARREYDGTGVTVSAIMPSAVRTELSSGADLSVLPTVDPDDVAAQILRTLTTRAATTSSPTWVLPGWGLVEAFLPETVERFARRLIGHDQAMALDPIGRRTYLDRIERHASQNAAVGGRAAAEADR